MNADEERLERHTSGVDFLFTSTRSLNLPQVVPAPCRIRAGPGSFIVPLCPAIPLEPSIPPLLSLWIQLAHDGHLINAISRTHTSLLELASPPTLFISFYTATTSTTDQPEHSLHSIPVTNRIHIDYLWSGVVAEVPSEYYFSLRHPYSPLLISGLRC